MKSHDTQQLPKRKKLVCFPGVVEKKTIRNSVNNIIGIGTY